MMPESRLTILMSRYFSSEASPAEERELDQLLASDPEAASRFRTMKQFWEQHELGAAPDVEEGLQSILQKLDLPLEKEEPIRRFPGWLKATVAAAAILVAAFFIARPFMLSKNDTGTAMLTEKHNSKGIKSTIELADGSKVWLNADSKISYPDVFAGNTREVYLKGEAFFEVTKNPSKPFIIHLDGGTVRVLGTSFNIRAYENEKVVETSVSTGKVAFIPSYSQPGKKRDTIFLLPDNKVKYYLKEEEALTSTTSAKDDKAWTEGKLVFKSKTMEEIAVELERNFGKKVVFADSEPRAYLLTGSFQNNSLDEIMYYLSKTKNFNYKITNTELVIALSTDSLQTY